MSAPSPGGVAAALEHLIAEHEAAHQWADELSRELATAQSRLRALSEAISAAARLLPEPDRAAARAALSPAKAPAPGTHAAALLEFLRTHEDPFTPSDLAAWLKEAGHPVPAPRDAARLLGRAEKRGLVRREGRGIYRGVV
jgi:cell division septum initiation protein DivIVA